MSKMPLSLKLDLFVAIIVGNATISYLGGRYTIEIDKGHVRRWQRRNERRKAKQRKLDHV